MENKEVPLQAQKINTLISKNEEISRRLRTEEAQKARALLATAMSHLEAHRMVKNNIIKKMNGNGKIK